MARHGTSLPATACGAVVAMAALFSATSLAAPVSDYVKAGCPPPDRAWSDADYVKFGELLKTGKIELPMLNDESKPIFLALVNREGLARYLNKDVPLRDRLNECLKGYMALLPVLKQYGERYDAKADCSREAAGVIALVIYSTTSLVNLMEELLPTIPKDDNYEARMAGIQQMKGGIRTILLSAADSLASTFAEEDVLTILEAMNENLPAQGEFVGPAFVQELRAKVAGFLGKEKSAKIKAAVQRLLKTCDSLALKQSGDAK